MYNKIKSLKTIVERRKSRIVRSWTYNHKLLLVTLSLVVVILWGHYQVGAVIDTLVDKLTYEHIATNKQVESGACDYECLTSEWVELRTEEIMLENLENYKTESRYQALLEANRLITEI